MKFEIKTQNEAFSQSFLSFFLTFALLSFIVILSNISIKLGTISKNYEIICFIDDLKALHNRTIWDLPIKSIDHIDKISNIDEIFLAKPRLNKEAIRKIYLKAKNKSIGISEIPSIEDITLGKTKIDSLKPISIESLLGRDEIYVNLEYVKPIIENNSICVTGSGGSIGSELCEQIIRLKPQKLILFEQSEINLYKLN